MFARTHSGRWRDRGDSQSALANRQAAAQRRTGAKGLFVRASAREEPAQTGGEISPKAMVLRGWQLFQVMRSEKPDGSEAALRW